GRLRADPNVSVVEEGRVAVADIDTRRTRRIAQLHGPMTQAVDVQVVRQASACAAAEQDIAVIARLDVQLSAWSADSDANVAGVGVEHVVAVDGPGATAAGAGEGIQGVRDCGHGLARCKRSEIAGTGGRTYGDLKPALAAVKRAGAEVQGGGKQPV